MPSVRDHLSCQADQVGQADQDQAERMLSQVLRQTPLLDRVRQDVQGESRASPCCWCVPDRWLRFTRNGRRHVREALPARKEIRRPALQFSRPEGKKAVRMVWI